MSGMVSLDRLSEILGESGFRPIKPGETRDEYCKAWGAWMSVVMTPLAPSEEMEQCLNYLPMPRREAQAAIIEMVTGKREGELIFREDEHES